MMESHFREVAENLKRYISDAKFQLQIEPINVQRLNCTMDAIEVNITYLVENYKYIIFGQIATKVEKTLIDHLLLNCSYRVNCRQYLTLNQVRRDLENPSGIVQIAQVKIIKSRLEKLKREYNWKDFHYEAINKFKTERNKRAHPEMQLKEVEDIIKECGTHKDRQMLEKFLSILKKFKIKNIKT